MALSTTSITLAQIKAETGLTSNDLSTICLHADINRWGFNTPLSPTANYQTKFWSVSVPASPYPMGAFLGYDHEWRCYAFDTKPALSVGQDDILENITIGFHYFPAWSEAPVGSVTQHFKVEWDSVSNFASPAILYADYPVVNGADIVLPTLNTGARGYAPDGVTTLLTGGGCYYRITYLSSSEDRRWDENNSMNGGDNPGEMVFQVTITASAWTKYAQIADNGTFLAYDDSATNKAVMINSAEASLDWYEATNINVTAEVDSSPTFDSAEKETLSDTLYFATDYTVPRPNQVFSLSTDTFHFSVGETIYARMKISSVPAGITNLSSNWIDLGSTVVLNNLPL